MENHLKQPLKKKNKTNKNSFVEQQMRWRLGEVNEAGIAAWDWNVWVPNIQLRYFLEPGQNKTIPSVENNGVQKSLRKMEDRNGRRESK